MRRISLSLTLIATPILLLLQAAPGHAQASRTWVSGVGDDANPCSRTAPCKTFAGAISKTALNGEINCLDPGGFGAVTITKSITIDCHEVFASILNSGTNGVNVPFDSFNAADVRKTVRLRNINFNGVDTGVIGIRITGGSVIAAGVVIIEDCLIDGDFGGNSRGISDERVGGGELYVSNTTVRNALSAGIFISPANNTVPGQRIDAAFDNVRIQNSGLGLAVGSNGRAMISRSTFSGNSGAGVAVGSTQAATEANISNSTISNNATGILNVGGTTTIRLSNNDISFNTTGISGATQSHTNNRIQGNGTPGTAPTAIGGTTNPTGQQ
jgi:Right handed beta helix region